MMTLFRKLFWVALFLIFTLGFVTLFDHGYTTTNLFIKDAKGEVADVLTLWRASRPPEKKPDQPAN